MLNMEKKILGKISSAEFGKVRDYPFLIGLQLNFKFDGGGVGDGGINTVNISKGCKWEYPAKRAESLVAMIENINTILTDAKVENVSQLEGKPVEIIIKGNVFQSFRILTEVL
jgi:hypothetical protein